MHARWDGGETYQPTVATQNSDLVNFHFENLIKTVLQARVTRAVTGTEKLLLRGATRR